MRGGEGDIFLVKCVASSNIESDGSRYFTVDKSYRAKLASEDEYNKRGIWIWVENNVKTANGFSMDYFYKRFVDVYKVRENKLKELGIHE